MATLVFASCVPSFAQKNNHKLSSLISAEAYLNKLIIDKGINEAYVKVSDENAVGFKPNPVNLKTYYQNTEINYDSLTWEPKFAMLSKSKDFGFTSGPYTYTQSQTQKKTYGYYVSVWKSNEKNNWKLMIEGGVACPQISKNIQEEFNSPLTDHYNKMLGPKKLQMRADIVYSSDELLGKALKISGNQILKEFYSANVRFYFPEYEPIKGIENVLPFINDKQINFASKPIKADGAKSGDLAYSYGTAKITVKNETKDYHYIRLWQKQADDKWYVILDEYIPK